MSSLTFKSYEQKREKWMGTAIHHVNFDEPPPDDVYTEGLTRILTTGGIATSTFTPLEGVTAMVDRFLSGEAFCITVGWDDVPHLDEETKEILLAAYPPHERDARSKGKPIMGSGLVFPYSEQQISFRVPLNLAWGERDPHGIPAHFARIGGIDFGTGDEAHPFAAAWWAIDRDTSRAYLYDAVKTRDPSPEAHIDILRSRGEDIPIAWPHDGNRRAGIGQATKVVDIYRQAGLRMLGKHAQFLDGSNSLEAGVYEMSMEMEAGRIKIAEHLRDLWREYSIYHRKDGKIVDKRDDILSAARYGFIMRRFARGGASTSSRPRRSPEYSPLAGPRSKGRKTPWAQKPRS